MEFSRSLECLTLVQMSCNVLRSRSPIRTHDTLTSKPLCGAVLWGDRDVMDKRRACPSCSPHVHALETSGSANDEIIL